MDHHHFQAEDEGLETCMMDGMCDLSDYGKIDKIGKVGKVEKIGKVGGADEVGKVSEV